MAHLNLQPLHGYNSNLINKVDRVRVNVLFDFESKLTNLGQNAVVGQILDKMNEKWGDLNGVGTALLFDFALLEVS